MRRDGHLDARGPDDALLWKPMSRVRRRRGRPSTTPSRSTKKTDSPGRFGCVTQGRRPPAMNARCESALRGSTARCCGVEVVAALEPVVLVAGAFRKQRRGRLRRSSGCVRRSAAPSGCDPGSRRSCATTSTGSADTADSARCSAAKWDRSSTTSNRALGRSSSVRSSGCGAIKLRWDSQAIQ